MIDNFIKAHYAERNNRLLKGFGQSGQTVKRGLTEKEFNDRYGAGYNVFSQGGIDKFKSDAIQKGFTQEEIDRQLKDLTKVFVQKGKEVVTLFVSKIEPEQD